MLAAAALAVLLVGSGLAWWRTSAGGDSNGDPAFAVSFSGTPSVRWQHTLKDWAPELNCSTASGADDVDGAGCSASVVTTSDRFVIVQGSHGMDRNLLLAVDKASGAVAWKRPLPSGVDVSCAGDDSRVWCLLNPRSAYADYTADPGEPARLMVSATGGADEGNTKLGTGDHVLVGASDGAAFVGAQDLAKEAEGAQKAAPFTLIKFDGAGKQQWSTAVPGGIADSAAAGPVLRDGDVDYLLQGATADGGGLGFLDGDGAFQRIAGGGVEGVFRGAPVSRPKTGGTWIGGQQISNDDPVLPYWRDSNDFPLITADSGRGGESAMARVRSDAPPYAVQRTVTGVPLAYCGGALIVLGDPDPGLGGVALRSVDPRTGHVNWAVTVPDPAEFVICGSGQILVGGAEINNDAAGGISGYAAGTGKRLWTSHLPAQSMLANVDRHSLVFAQMGTGDESLQQIALVS
ncbi:hypothetical protein AZH51_10675 [Branchiibius sp. NY16-3462-2]|nr:hypothetical protein AZH51_10675 [Branchiibius sp. NY16-3462-2]